MAICAMASTVVALTGCGFSGSNTAIKGPVPLRGTVRGGEHPVVGASIQLYAAGVTGNGSAAERLLVHPVRSDSNGNFSIAGSISVLQHHRKST